MSIRIPYAYRILKGHDYWDVLMNIQDKARKNIKKTLRKVYADLLDNWTTDPKAFAAAYKEIWGMDADPEDKKVTTLFARDFVQKMYNKQSGRMDKNEFDLDVCVAVRRVNKRYLLIPYPGSGLFWNSLRFMEKMPELEDYHYQNASDAPYEDDPKSKITKAMWKRRERTWRPILDEPKWSEMLVLDICSTSAFTKVDPWFDDFIAASKKAGK